MSGQIPTCSADQITVTPEIINGGRNVVFRIPNSCLVPTNYDMFIYKSTKTGYYSINDNTKFSSSPIINTTRAAAQGYSSDDGTMSVQSPAFVSGTRVPINNINLRGVETNYTYKVIIRLNYPTPLDIVKQVYFANNNINSFNPPVPVPAPVPRPVPVPAPVPRPVPVPAPVPRPVPAPAPRPVPRPAPAPVPRPVPAPVPYVPLPIPAPVPVPVPIPSPVPVPVPIPSPVPATVLSRNDIIRLNEIIETLNYLVSYGITTGNESYDNSVSSYLQLTGTEFDRTLAPYSLRPVPEPIPEPVPAPVPYTTRLTQRQYMMLTMHPDIPPGIMSLINIINNTYGEGSIYVTEQQRENLLSLFKLITGFDYYQGYVPSSSTTNINPASVPLTPEMVARLRPIVDSIQPFASNLDGWRTRGWPYYNRSLINNFTEFIKITGYDYYNGFSLPPVVGGSRKKNKRTKKSKRSKKSKKVTRK